MREDMHARRVEPEEERLVVLPSLVHERKRIRQYLVIHGLHAFWTEFAAILDPLLADLPPARLVGRVVDIGCPTVNDVARPDLFLQRRWVIRMARVLHRVKMVEVTIELVKTVHRRQELVQV